MESRIDGEIGDTVVRGNLVAVAVDKGSKGSRDALRWIIDHHLAPRGRCVMLVHVVSPTSTLPICKTTLFFMFPICEEYL